MREIPLTKGKVALVDDEDFERLAVFKWSAVLSNGVWRARCFVKTKTVYMHRLILNAPPDRTVDHQDGDGLNNQRYNLRLATSLQQSHNRRFRVNSKRPFKGVRRDGTGWSAFITAPKTPAKFIGYFQAAEDAARAYDAKARELFGEFACVNFPTNDRERPALLKT